MELLLVSRGFISIPLRSSCVGIHLRDECCSARGSAQSADLYAAARASAALWPRPESPRAERGSTFTPKVLLTAAKAAAPERGPGSVPEAGTAHALAQRPFPGSSWETFLSAEWRHAHLQRDPGPSSAQGGAWRVQRAPPPAPCGAVG